MMDHLKNIMCTIITNIRPQRIKPIDRVPRKKYCANGISIFFFLTYSVKKYCTRIVRYYCSSIMVVLKILRCFYYIMYLSSTKQHLRRSYSIEKKY